MTSNEFDLLLEERVAKIRAVLKYKATEYASADDRLYNFKQGAKLRKQTSEDTLLGYLSKHWINLEGLAARFEAGRLIEELRGQIDEKIGDAINYLILLEALLLEKLNQEVSHVPAAKADDP